MGLGTEKESGGQEVFFAFAVEECFDFRFIDSFVAIISEEANASSLIIVDRFS